MSDASVSGYTVAQDDLRELMRALRIPTHARPETPHEVFQNEVMPKIAKWSAALGQVRASAQYATNGDDLYTITGTVYAEVEEAIDGR